MRESILVAGALAAFAALPLASGRGDSVAGPSGQGTAEKPQAAPAPEVKVALVSDVAAVAPGGELEVAVHLGVPEGWHVGWENPGDLGEGTKAKLFAPKGFDVRGPLYPGPERIEMPDEVVCYGYRGDAVLFFKVRAPQELILGSRIPFYADVAWTACGGETFAGKARADLQLEVGAEARPSSSEARALLDLLRARLPRPQKELARIQAHWTRLSEDMGEGARHALTVVVAGAGALEFFPDRRNALIPCGLERSADSRGAALVLTFEFLGAKGEEPRLRGVLQVDRPEGRAFHSIDIACELK